MGRCSYLEFSLFGYIKKNCRPSTIYPWEQFYEGQVDIPYISSAGLLQ